MRAVRRTQREAQRAFPTATTLQTTPFCSHRSFRDNHENGEMNKEWNAGGCFVYAPKLKSRGYHSRSLKFIKGLSLLSTTD